MIQEDQPIPDNVFVHSGHALLAHKLALLRDRRTSPASFGRLLDESSAILLASALASVPRRRVSVRSPNGVSASEVFGATVGFVPILRAGIGMAKAARLLLPGAPIWYLGLHRDEKTLRPVCYYDKLREYAPIDVAIILDPMLATGGTAIEAVSRLKEKGVRDVRFVGLVAAPEGLAALRETHPDVAIHLIAVDERLDERGYIVPGLGDVGDRVNATGQGGDPDDRFVPEEALD